MPRDSLTAAEAVALTRDMLESDGIPVVDVIATAFPEEVVILAKVDQDLFDSALRLGPKIDAALQSRGFEGFVTLRGEKVPELKSAPLTRGVHDDRIPKLVALLATRSRTSEAQPSLSYVPDAAANATLITTGRHHLVFGRRGAGKTALLLEGRRLAVANGDVVSWTNIQTHRDSPAETAFLWVVRDLLAQVEAVARSDVRVGTLSEELVRILGTITTTLDKGTVPSASGVVPRIRQILARFGATTGHRAYVFVDDFHYLDRVEQPQLLDLLHRSVRDCDVWLKVAAIKHLTRWFDSANHVGLETGHDADHIELDLTLQDPARAKQFLDEVLRRYAQQTGVSALSKVLSSDSLDRLVLASGAVPRDFLILASRAIQRCQARPNSKVVGVQDVNAAAGDAARVKIDELEDDLAASANARNSTLEGLRVVRSFCLDEKSYTYFRVGFRDKDQRPDEYAVLSSLLDVRLLHLLEPSLSDPHHAGERSEVYMLDLSQFSGQRLKHYLRVLDLWQGHFVSRETRRTSTRSIGDTPRKLNTILRASPLLDLALLRQAL